VLEKRRQIEDLKTQFRMMSKEVDGLNFDTPEKELEEFIRLSHLEISNPSQGPG
jgi:hypothetical protein